MAHVRRSPLLFALPWLAVACSSASVASPTTVKDDASTKTDDAGDETDAPADASSVEDAPNGSLSLVSLTDTERGALCDYLNVTVSGGYDQDSFISCYGENVPVTTAKSQAACIATLQAIPKACTATVSDREGCTQAVYADPCSTVKPVAPVTAACAAVDAAGCTTPKTVDGG